MLLRLLKAHLSAGYRIAAFSLPIIMLIFLVFDIINVINIGANPLYAFSFNISAAWGLTSIKILLFHLIMWPILIAPWISLSRGARSLTSFLRIKGLYVILAYFILSFLSSYGYIYSQQLVSLCGMSYINITTPQPFYSYYLFLLSNNSVITTYIISFISYILAVATIIGLEKSTKMNINTYLTILELSAVSGSLAPTHKRTAINLNSGSLAPGIKGIVKIWFTEVQLYYKYTSGSSICVRQLKELWEDIKRLLKDYGINEHESSQIRIVENTSRALEIAIIEHMSENCSLLLSPYEHPTEYITCIPIIETHKMEVPVEFYNLSWSEQKKEIVEWANTQTGRANSIIFVLSEVFYLNGTIIPIKELIDDLKNALNISISVIIDGAHSLGNVTNYQINKEYDAYIYSGHKWLLSPEPCGLVVSNNTMLFHDAWLNELPSSSVGISRVSSLYAALKYFEKFDKKVLDLRKKQIKEIMNKEMHERLSIIGDKSGLRDTNIVCYTLNKNIKWRADVEVGELRNILEKRNIYVETYSIPSKLTPSGTIAMRISINYFLDWRAILEFKKSIYALTETV